MYRDTISLFGTSGAYFDLTVICKHNNLLTNICESFEVKYNNTLSLNQGVGSSVI